MGPEGTPELCERREAALEDARDSGSEVSRPLVPGLCGAVIKRDLGRRCDDALGPIERAQLVQRVIEEGIGERAGTGG